MVSYNGIIELEIFVLLFCAFCDEDCDFIALDDLSKELSDDFYLVKSETNNTE